MSGSMWPFAAKMSWPSVQIVIEEKCAEGQAEQTRPAHRRGRSFIDKKSIAFVVIQPEHLIREIADKQVRPAGMIVIGGIDAHCSTRHAIFAVSDARLHAFFRERAVAVVPI